MTDVLKDKSGILIEGHIKIFDPEKQRSVCKQTQCDPIMRI